MPLPEGAHHFELSEGELIIVENAGMRHESIKSRIVTALILWIAKSESATDAEKKVDEYLNAGVQEVWQIYPAEQIVRVRRPGSIKDYSAQDILTSVVLNGFSAQVASFFTDLI